MYPLLRSSLPPCLSSPSPTSLPLPPCLSFLSLFSLSPFHPLLSLSLLFLLYCLAPLSCTRSVLS